MLHMVSNRGVSSERVPQSLLMINSSTFLIYIVFPNACLTIFILQPFLSHDQESSLVMSHDHAKQGFS